MIKAFLVTDDTGIIYSIGKCKEDAINDFNNYIFNPSVYDLIEVDVDVKTIEEIDNNMLTSMKIKHRDSLPVYLNEIK